MSKKKVLFIGDLNIDLPQYKHFSQKFECIHYSIPLIKEEMIAAFQNKFSNIDAIYGAWLGFMPYQGFQGDLLESAPQSLKIIAICSVGYDGYDSVRMREKGMLLTNVPSDGSAEPVADLVLYNTLAAFRNFKMSTNAFLANLNHTVQARHAQASASFSSATGKLSELVVKPGYSFGHKITNMPCSSPKGHHVVIVGFGKVGRTIGERLSLIGMHIHYVKRSPLSESDACALGYQAQYHASIEDAAAIADLVVVACPSSPETYRLLNRDTFNRFAKPVRVINVGRGLVIDEQALVDALKEGKVVFAGLDVFENEPKVHPDLLGRDDVILTPHVGGSTVENFNYTSVVAMQNIEAILEGREALTLVN
ncbi:NAD(P)-binding protein [Metschnikowia bicuspidata]|uniref:NAD(P)-binding protein n=1 Tax=Metschnikowia bicuspidata TaxID=27322 RepID=A0A4P9ZG18_9ASCO|nr:NAD(P)-binding protein [Metschnikowia bicuspidata]